MRWRIPLIAALAMFVAVGCDQQPAEPVDDSITAPAFNYSNNDGWLANGKIFRHGHDFLWIGWDYDRGLIASFSTIAGDWCGLGQPMEQIAAQHLYNNPDLADEIEHLFLQGDVWVELFDWGLWDPFDCANWATATHLASGEMHIVWTDNDNWGAPGRTNAYGLRGEGKLALDGGGFTSINYKFHHTWNANTGETPVIFERLKISKDPR